MFMVVGCVCLLIKYGTYNYRYVRWRGCWNCFFRIRLVKVFETTRCNRAVAGVEAVFFVLEFPEFFLVVKKGFIDINTFGSGDLR